MPIRDESFISWNILFLASPPFFTVQSFHGISREASSRLVAPPQICRRCICISSPLLTAKRGHDAECGRLRSSIEDRYRIRSVEFGLTPAGLFFFFFSFFERIKIEHGCSRCIKHRSRKFLIEYLASTLNVSHDTSLTVVEFFAS